MRRQRQIGGASYIVRSRGRFGGLYPSFSANFLSGVMPAAITFTRASNSTYYNSSGILTTAVTNAPRFDYDPITLAPRGLLIEGSRTNLCLQSEDFSTTWAKAGTLTTNVATAPDGNLTADKFASDGASTNHLLSQTTAPSSAVVYTLSVYAKAVEESWIQLTFGTTNWSGLAYQNYNVSTGVLGSSGGTGGSASIQNVGNGWYRCSFTATSSGSTAGQTGPIIALTLNGDEATRLPVHVGTTGNGAYFWGAQLEQVSQGMTRATSYIATTTTTATRATDAASITTLSSIGFSQTTGTIVVGFDVLAFTTGSNGSYVCTVDAGSATNQILFDLQNFAFGAQIGMNSAGVFSTSGGALSLTSGVPVKMAMAYSSGNNAAYGNGSSMGTGLNATTFSWTMTAMKFGSGFGTSNPFFGHIQKMDYYNTRLPNAQLQTLTT